MDEPGYVLVVVLVWMSPRMAYSMHALKNCDSVAYSENQHSTLQCLFILLRGQLQKSWNHGSRANLNLYYQF